MEKREILFRGKRTDNGEWIEGEVLRDGLYGKYYFKNKNDCLDDNLYEVEENEENGFLQFKAYEVDPETVCPYTGLTDKNGRKIFEGDICKIDDLIYKVSFKCSHWNFDIISEKVYCCPWFDSHCGEYCEIIGNIFDNQELLEE